VFTKEELERREHNNQQYLLIGGFYSQLENLIKADTQYSRFPCTARALYYGIKKIDAQVSVLMESDAKHNYYVNNILFRTIIEHFLVTYYIGTRCRVERSDAAGEHYYGAYKAKEFVKRMFKFFEIEQIRHQKESLKEPELFQRLNSALPDGMPMLTTSVRNDIYLFASQFDENRIIKYLLKEASTDIFADVNVSLFALLNTYNVVCSNVHGGPSAELECYYDSNTAYTLRQNFIHIDLCKYTSYQLKLSLFHLLKDNRQNEEYKRVLALLDYFLDSRITWRDLFRFYPGLFYTTEATNVFM
jgi:hypothetical protein